MKILFVILLNIAITTGIFYFFVNQKSIESINPLVRRFGTTSEKPLKKYTFSELRKRKNKAGEIILSKLISEDEQITSYLFFFSTEGKKVSGLINIPKQKGIYPVIILLRGYVDKEIYTTGIGSKNVGEALARSGFITLAPDFLGYGKSDNPSVNVMEERFQTYTTTLDLLASLPNLNSALSKKNIVDISTDINKTGIWGHSNGGHIAIAILEITGKEFPTVLWAPVSKAFPYSILYYTDEAEDKGKLLRKKLAEFEQDYDVDNFTITNYYHWIKAPVQIHQGTKDEAVPQKWSDELYNKLTELEIEVDYFTYTGDDHNLVLGGWSTAVERTIDFFYEKFSL